MLYSKVVGRNERDKARETAAYRAQEWTPVLRAIKAMPDSQAEIFELAEVLFPPPLNPQGMVDWRTRETREWHHHQLAVMRVWIDLVNAGLVEIIIPADGAHGDLFTLSKAGYRWLTEYDALADGKE